MPDEDPNDDISIETEEDSAENQDVSKAEPAADPSADEDGSLEDDSAAPEESAAGESAEPTTSEQIRRKRNRQRLFSIGVVVLLLAILGVLLSGGFDTQTETPVVEIAPRILFDQLVDQVINEETKTIHAEDFSVDDEILKRVDGLESS